MASIIILALRGYAFHDGGGAQLLAMTAGAIFPEIVK
jgi:hypothetical protein